MTKSRVLQLYHNHTTKPHKTLYDLYKKPSYYKERSWYLLTKLYADLTAVSGNCSTYTATSIDRTTKEFVIHTAYNTYKYDLEDLENA